MSLDRASLGGIVAVGEYTRVHNRPVLFDAIISSGASQHIHCVFPHREPDNLGDTARVDVLFMHHLQNAYEHDFLESFVNDGRQTLVETPLPTSILVVEWSILELA